MIEADQSASFAPDWVLPPGESVLDLAEERGWTDGDLLAITTPRGRVEAPLRVTGVRRGVVFLPFHYGYWDRPAGHEPDGHGRAANELTLTAWDPASKQPLFKTAAAQVERIEARTGATVASMGGRA